MEREMNKEQRIKQILEASTEYVKERGYYTGQLDVAFIDGAEWADEHPNLTWEDIPEIFRIAEQLKTSWWFRDNEQTKMIGTQVFWEEVLKRFLDYKERKEK